jgi:hypothetical protein
MPKIGIQIGPLVRKESSKKAQKGSSQNIEFNTVSTNMAACGFCISSIQSTQYYPPRSKLQQGMLLNPKIKLFESKNFQRRT